jgi:uncharacterized protein (DUF362 family)
LVHIQQTAISEAINTSLELIDYKFHDVKNMVIKPNLCYYWHHSTGNTTDPAFIGALINVLRQKTKPDTKISIIESDASAMKCKHVFKFLGYDKLSRDYNVDLINLSEDKFDSIKVKVGNCQIPIKIPHVIKNADLRINVPKLKYTTGNGLGITCAMKNLYGCNPNAKKYKLHPIVGEAVVAFNKAMPFNLCLLDGNIVTGVRTRRLGLVMASQDPVAFDSAAARIAGLNPNKLKFLQLARKEGLGATEYIERGLPLDYFKGWYPKEDITMKLKGKAINLLVRRTGIGSRLGL